MKGEWLRHQDKYISDGIKWNEANWTEPHDGGQRERYRRDLDKYGMKPHFFLYHDDTAVPETFAYNGATTANLLDMLESGYEGASAKEMREIISRNLRSSLLMLSGSGEAPGGGRTGEHIWDDSIYANAFQLMTEATRREGDDFSSILGQVKGTLYTGRTAAGGLGKAIDFDADGKEDLSFDAESAFIVRHAQGKLTALETDRRVKATYAGRSIALEPYTSLRGSKWTE